MNDHVYVPPQIIIDFHHVPRFDHPTDLSLVITEEVSPTDYGRGLFFIPILIFAIFFIWNLTMAILKFSSYCCRSGCENNILNGAPPREGSKSIYVYRGTIFISIISILILGSISLTNARGSLVQSFREVRNVMDNVQYIVDEVQEAANSATDAQKNFEDSRIRTKSLLEYGICQDPSKVTAADNTIAIMLNVLDDVGDWSSLVEGALEDVQNTLEIAEQTYVEDVYKGIDVVEDYASISWIMITMLIFAFMLLIGEFLACFGFRLKTFFCIQGWVILPLFMMSLALSIFIACVCAITLVINSDTCIGSATGDPEGLVKVLVKYEMLDLPYKELLDHYIFEACTNTPELIELVDYILDQTILYHDQFKTSVTSLSAPETISLLETQCGNGISLAETVSTLVSFTKVTEALIPIAQNAKNVIDCPTVFGIYQEFTHDFVCETLPITFGWIFWCVVLYSFFGMLVFTFRGALFPSVPFDEYGEIKDEAYEYEVYYVESNNKDDTHGKDTVAPLRKGGDDYLDSQKESQIKKGTRAETGYEEDGSLILDPTYSTSTDSSP